MIYLDHHATTPVDRRVLDRMLPFFSENFGNAASRQHRFGWEANDAVEAGRKQVAALIGASTREVVFTSGATEANNLAIKGTVEFIGSARDHIVTVATEHSSVLDPCRSLESEGWRVTVLPVGRDGLLDVNALDRAVTSETALVSVMAANNEIGVLQPLREVAAIAHARGAMLHTDAVQAVGRIPIDVRALDVDLLSMTAHKLYGPKGVGALFVKKGLKLTPQIDGGRHERGLRSGTLNVPGIVGFGAAAEIAGAEMPAEAKRLRALRDRLLARLRKHVDGLSVNGTLQARLPGNLNVSFDRVDGEALLVGLEGVAVSSGAACTAAEPSHVLLALGLPRDRALASLRFGLGRHTTEQDVDDAASIVAKTVEHLQAVSA